MLDLSGGSNTAFPVMVRELLPSGIKGVVLGGAIAALMSSLAGVFNAPFEEGNPDLYSGVSESSRLPTAIQPGIGDAYGSMLLPGGLSERPHVHQKGTNDGYGSILIDIGHDIDW